MSVCPLQVLHLMRCPAGLVWDNVHKLCMESSSTCHAPSSSFDPAPAPPVMLDSTYMQYFANLAAAGATDSSSNAALTQPRTKDNDRSA